MKTLCIDIGNTNINYAVVENNKIFDEGVLPTISFSKKNILSPVFNNLIQNHSIRACSYCSVVPEYNEALINHLPSDIELFELNSESVIGLDLSYPNPIEIGHDRIANAVAAQTYFSIPCIVVDLGTAITLDIITTRGYEGGIIAPGFNLMSNYLHEKTALLPKLNLDPDQIKNYNHQNRYGKSTKEAIEIGISVGFSGMIESLIKVAVDSIKEKYETTPTILSTGGNVLNIRMESGLETKFIKGLTLMGLSEAYYRFFNKDNCN